MKPTHKVVRRSLGTCFSQKPSNTVSGTLQVEVEVQYINFISLSQIVIVSVGGFQ